jgi:molecular chaperone DnaJ
MATNYYAILGVGNDASADAINSAFRLRAQELHPDRSGLDSASFLDLQDAYCVLGDPLRRSSYDCEILRAKSESRVSPGAEPLVPKPGEAQYREVSLSSYEHYTPSFEELFSRWWINFGQLSRPKSERIESLTVEIVLGPSEVLSGGRVSVMIPARAICPGCRGNGAVGGYECWRCEGQGALTSEYPVDLDYPPGVQDGYAVRIPLNRFGIDNFYLTMLFRVAG